MRVGSGSDRDRNRIRSGSDPKGFARNVCRLAETAITDRQDRRRARRPERRRVRHAGAAGHAGAAATARHDSALGAGSWGRRPDTASLRRPGRRGRGPAWSTRSWDTGSRSRLSLSTLEKHLKIAACDGVLEFFPQETLVYKNVDGGRQYAGPVLSLEKAD